MHYILILKEYPQKPDYSSLNLEEKRELRKKLQKEEKRMLKRLADKIEQSFSHLSESEQVKNVSLETNSSVITLLVPQKEQVKLIEEKFNCGLMKNQNVSLISPIGEPVPFDKTI